MKKLLTILLIITVCIGTLCGCGRGDSTREKISTWKPCGYIDVTRGEDYTVYYDVDSKVMYAVHAHRVTVLLNPDGTPMLYEGGAE